MENYKVYVLHESTVTTKLAVKKQNPNGPPGSYQVQALLPPKELWAQVCHRSYFPQK